MIPAEVRNHPEHELHVRYTLTTELTQSVGGLFVYSVVELSRCCLTSTDQNLLGDDGVDQGDKAGEVDAVGETVMRIGNLLMSMSILI